MQFDSKIQGKTFIITIVCAFFLITGLCSYYTVRVYKTMKAESDHYLLELSAESADCVLEQIEADVSSLQMAAETVSIIDDAEDGWRQVRDYMSRISETYQMKDLGYVNKEGMAYFTDGRAVNLSDSAYVQEVLEGKTVISQAEGAGIDSRKMIVYSVPIWKNEQVTGALIQQNIRFDLKADLKIEGHPAKGYSYVVDSNGDYVAADKRALLSYGNFFSYLDAEVDLQGKGTLKQIRSDMQDGKSGLLYYHVGKNEYAMSYISLGFNQWYLLCPILVNHMIEQRSLVMYAGIGIDGCILIAMGLVILGLFLMQRKNLLWMEQVAYVDPVTGGMNSARFGQLMEEAITSSPEYAYAFIALDIRGFKLVNETFGEEAGDQVLCHLYHVICKNLGQGEYAARFSEDHFKLLLHYHGNDELVRRMEEIAENLNAFNETNDVAYYMILHVGIRIVDNPESSQIIIRDQANIARKQCKNLVPKKNCACAFYVVQDEKTLLKEWDIINRFERALKNNEFKVHFQPKVGLKDQKLVGAEALVRWKPEDNTVIYPDEFIPVIEKNGMIVQLDLYMFRNVCCLLKKWMDQGKPLIPISVNFSRSNMSVADILKKYQEIQKEYGIPPCYLEIELTETMISENISYFREVVDKIHEMGFSCAMDDFGSGYSSMNMLKEIPVDTLKLDRMFFSGEKSQESQERLEIILKCVIELAQRLRVQVVAEGIETSDQVDFLERLHCDIIQGYYFYKPMPVEAYEKLITDR